jgi:hypothetical protein
MSPLSALDRALGQLGAVQIWANCRRDRDAGFTPFRGALALGGTVSTSELFSAAGATFSLDDHTLREAVDALQQALQD